METFGFQCKSLTTKLHALLHSFFDSKQKMKIPKENASKRTESSKTKVFKRKETYETVSTSKENKVKVINNKETKDKADDKISKSKETIKKLSSESDTNESNSPQKRKLVVINSNVLFCIKQNSIVSGVKSVHSCNHAKKILMPSSVLFV